MSSDRIHASVAALIAPARDSGGAPDQAPAVRGSVARGADFVFAVPGSLDTPTGGYAYDRRMIAELEKLGCRAELLDLGNGFPWPSPQTGVAALRKLSRIRRGRPAVVDGLALGVLPDAARALARRLPLIALVHHPLALETDLSIEDSLALRISEFAALSHARHVIVTSSNTKRILARDYGVERSRITVIRPGTDPVRDSGERRPHGGSVQLLAVGSLVPRKGYDILLDALATLRDLPWRMTIVGDRDRSPETATQIAVQITQQQLSDRVRLEGAVPAERLARLYAEADVFVLPSRFEGYGMAYAEALAHGLPIIGTRAGAIPQVVPASAGILVWPEDGAAVASALRILITDPDERARLAAGARRAAARLPTWPQAARAFRRVLAAVA